MFHAYFLLFSFFYSFLLVLKVNVEFLNVIKRKKTSSNATEKISK